MYDLGIFPYSVLKMVNPVPEGWISHWSLVVRHLLRVGFTTLDGDLLLGSSDLGVGFDSGLDHRMYAPGTSGNGDLAILHFLNVGLSFQLPLPLLKGPI